MLASCGEASLDPAALQGYWQSEEDSKSFLKIDDKQMVFVHDGKFMTADAYTFQANCKEACKVEMGQACLVANSEGQTMCYAVLDVNTEKLSLVYTEGTGQPLNYKKTAAFTVPEPTPEPSWEGKTLCYENVDKTQYNINSYVEMTIQEGKVSGFMVITSDQSHSGVGNLSGTIKDNIIAVDYAYTIEGSKQIETKSFKIEEGQLYEAEAELEEKDGKLVFKEGGNVEYNTQYKVVDCESIKEQIGWAKG